MPDQLLRHAIRNEFAGTFARWYGAHPDELKDTARLQAAHEEMFRLMTHILALLDKFTITARREK